MTRRKRQWHVRLAQTAEADVEDIICWTTDQFGEKQAQRYAGIISSALKALSEGPATTGVKNRSDILPGLMTLHLSRNRNKGRHFILFRVNKSEGNEIIEILRLPHDAMDLHRHLPKDDTV